MTLDSATREILEKYGPRCICCGALATRCIIYGTRVPIINFNCGSLQMNVEIPREVRESLVDSSVADEVNRLIGVWAYEIGKSEELSKGIEGKIQYNFGYHPVKEAPLCDTCGDPKLEYEDLDLAHLIREAPSTPISEPIRLTRFERITKDED